MTDSTGLPPDGGLPTDEAASLQAESDLLDQEDKEFDDLDDTTDDAAVESVQPIEDVDVEEDVDRFGPAPVGATLTPEETAEIQRQIAQIQAANATRGAGEQISLSPEAVS